MAGIGTTAKKIGGVLLIVVGSALILLGIIGLIEESARRGKFAFDPVILVLFVPGVLIGLKGINLLGDVKAGQEVIQVEKKNKESAEKGDPKAQFDLGVFYMGTPKFGGHNRLPEAKQWLEKASEQGYPGAEAKLKECVLKLRNVDETQMTRYTHTPVTCGDCVYFTGSSCREIGGRAFTSGVACTYFFIAGTKKCGNCKYFDRAKGNCESVHSETLPDTAACNRYSE
jgi:hypothetical protein